MKKNTIGLFAKREDAEKLINHIHKDLSIDHDDISYVYRNNDGEVKEVDSEDVSSMNTTEGAVKGAKVGATVGALAGLATAVGVIPVVGPLFAAGPLIAALGITGGLGVTAAGAATGAAVGGLAGALVALGTSSEKAKEYEDQVMAGNILVMVNSEDADKVTGAMVEHGAQSVETFEVQI